MQKITGTTTTATINYEQIPHHIGEIIKLNGAVYKIRKMSNFAFILLRTSRNVIQCVYSPEFSDFDLAVLKEEMSIQATAKVIPEERSKTGWELRLTDVKILSIPKELSPVVINNKRVDTSLETLLDYRPITIRNEKERAIFKIQEGISTGFRLFLQEQNFTEIHTPKIVFAGAEGGANIFRLPYFQKEAYLTQSPQFYKQMMVAAFERVYEIGPVFRAEKHDTSRHLNEYTSVDFEMGYIENFEEVMEMETRMLQYTMGYLKEYYIQEIQLLKLQMPEIEEIPAIKFAEAKELIARTYNREIKDYHDFEPEEEKLLSQIIQKQTGSEFVFVTHYPEKKRPFYTMEDPANPKETLSFDLIFRGLEITTGGQRIHSYQQQIEKMRARQMNPELFESYLMSHKYGLSPHGGLGLGLERFTSKLLGQENVRRAVLFPRDINRLTP